MEVRDTRKGEWHWVYNSLIEDEHLTAAEKLIYSAIASYASHGEVALNFETIGRRANLSERAAKGAVRRLEEVGYISVERGGGSGKKNVYFLLDMVKGCKICTLQKGCKPRQERVQSTTEKGAESAQFPGRYIGVKERYKDIGIKEGGNTPTPGDLARSFFEDAKTKEGRESGASWREIVAWASGLWGAGVEQELVKFALHWTEPTKSGRQEHWETKPTFEVRRRIVTWMGNAKRFGQRSSGRQGLVEV